VSQEIGLDTAGLSQEIDEAAEKLVVGDRSKRSRLIHNWRLTRPGQPVRLCEIGRRRGTSLARGRRTEETRPQGQLFARRREPRFDDTHRNGVLLLAR
jgi:hypothetical protein